MKQRGMKDLTLDEKRQILMELEIEKSSIVRDRHNISNLTISHLRWYYGRVAHEGSWHKDIVGDAKPPVMEMAAVLKKQNKTSLQIADELNIPLERINAVWARI
jgi:hypothetical protein